MALIPVILFHAGFEWFRGGYVGVDVFFVISGYLITSIILREKQTDTFTLKSFYERRARRILPALFFIIMVCIVPSWYWMMPLDLKSFSQSIVAVSLFTSNVLFWKKSGYFDAAAEENPLLHTWSLGVEEQYYVLFPVFIILFWGVGRKRLAGIVAAIAIASLGLSEYGWRHHTWANFYLIPARAWELLIGSLVAFASFSSLPHEHAGKTLNQLLSALNRTTRH